MTKTRLPAGFKPYEWALSTEQLSAKAAESIWQRVLRAHGRGRHIAPDAILAASVDELRATGLSASKVAFMKDLAARVAGTSHPHRMMLRVPRVVGGPPQH